jgi:hypothetical protein
VDGRGSSTVTGGHQRDRFARTCGGATLGAPLTPIFTPTDLNITRLRPTRLDEEL